MRSRDHDGLTAAYRDLGSGDPAIVMLHNGGTSSTIWRHQIEALATDHRVIAVDLPGFGASPRPDRPAELSDMVGWVADLIEGEHLAPAVMVGNCMGSNIAASLARSRGDLVAGVLAINPLTEASFSAGRIGLLHRVGRWAPRATASLRRVTRRLPVPRPFAVASLRFQLAGKGVDRDLHHDPELLACQLRPNQLPALLDVLDDMDSYGEMDSEQMPEGITTWIAWGEHNRVLSRSRSAHLLSVTSPRRTEVFPGCGHLPMLEDPDAVTSLVRDLVSAVTPADGGHKEALK